MSASAFQNALIDLIQTRALTPDAYENDKDNWQPMTYEKWCRMYVSGYCKFSATDIRVNLTMVMRHWEHVVMQSIMFDQDNFLNSLNTIVSEYGWYVESFSPPNENVDVTFHKFNGEAIIRNPPDRLYYFAAAWNKEDILKNGILTFIRADQISRRRFMDYDVLLRKFDLQEIRDITDNMYNASIQNQDVNDTTSNILRLIGYMPVIVFLVNTKKIAPHVYSRKEPIFDEDKEAGIFISYTYIPSPALESIVHEDKIPNVFHSI